MKCSCNMNVYVWRYLPFTKRGACDATSDRCDVIAPFPPKQKRESFPWGPGLTANIRPASKYPTVTLYHHSNHWPSLSSNRREKNKSLNFRNFKINFSTLENGYTRRSNCYCTATSKPCPNQARVSLNVTTITIWVALCWIIWYEIDF